MRKAYRPGVGLTTMEETQKKAYIYDGHSHIVRRVYTDGHYGQYVIINHWFFELCELEYEYELIY